jgi:Mn-containing catalase
MAKKKPSYIGLLNAIAVGEARAQRYLGAWADTTDDEAVAETIRFIALREGEHAMAFAKRMAELGFSVREGDPVEERAAMRAAKSKKLTDAEKFEHFGLARVKRGDDVFTGMFADQTIDPQTGGLLGRYIAEERDSLRRAASCYRRTKRNA